MISSRRRFLFGAGAALLAAPAIVRVSSLMAVKPLPQIDLSPGAINTVPTDFAEQYRQEFIRAFEALMPLLRQSVSTDSDLFLRTRDILEGNSLPLA